MQATAQKKKTATPIRGITSGSRAQAVLRPAPGNRQRADNFERQADEIGTGIIRGQQNLGRLITSRRAAAYQSLNEAGSVLPYLVRERMETALTADLAKVRIHTSAAADRAARSAGAEAFTSGRNIYFRSGRYTPHSSAGLELLAHELTHVLQQTGRRDHEGRLVVSAVAGAEEVQCKDDQFVTLAEKFNLFGNDPGWDEIKKAYENVPDAAAHSAIIAKYFPPTFPMSPDQIKALASETTTETFKSLSLEIKGLYADALKMVGGYDAARAIVIANTDVPTSFRSKSFYEKVRGATLSWIYRVTASQAFAKDYFPDRFIATYRTLFLYPGMGVTDLVSGAGKKGAETFHQKLVHEFASLKAIKGLMPNELQMTALLALYYLDDNRLQRIPQDLEQSRSQHESLLEAHRDLSQRYASGTVDQLCPDSSSEAKALFGAVLPRIQELATQAAKFWNRAIQIHGIHRTGAGFKEMSPTETKALANGINTDPRFKRLPGVFVDTGKQLFARSKGSLLSAGTFAERVVQRREALKAEILSYSPRIRELIDAGQDEGPEALRIGLAIAYLSEVEQVLFEHDARRDQVLSKRKLADVRIATRIRLAHKLLDIAVLFDWNDLREVANSVFLEGFQLALLSEWEADPNVDVGDLGKQAGGTLKNFEGVKISGTMLDRFLYIQFFDALTKGLSDLLTQRGSDFTDQAPILTEAMKKAKASMQLPRRFIVRNWEVGDPSMSKVKTTTAFEVPDFGKKIFDHPLTIDLRKREESNTEIGLAPAEMLPSSYPLFFWIVPKFDEFVKIISGITLIQTTLAKFWKATYGEAKPLPDPNKDPLGWLNALGELSVAYQNSSEVEKQKTLAELAKEISGAAEGKFEEAKTKAEAKAREAVNHERRIIVEKHLRPMLNTYDRNELRHWSIPGNVFSLIRNFGQFVWPKNDQLLQVSALVLEIADELMQAFGPKESVLGTSTIGRFDIIDTVLTLAFETVKTWDQGKAEAEKAGNPVHPITGISWLTQSELTKRAETLRKLSDSLGVSAEKEQKREGLRGKKDSRSLSSIYWDEEGFVLIKWNMSHTSVAQGQGFTLRGTDYLIIDVYETFTFHPGFGNRETLGINWPAGGSRPGNAKLFDESGNPWQPTGKKLLTVLRKPRFGDSQMYEITDRDTDKLAWFSSVLSEHFAFEYIKGAGVFIEKYAELIMDVLEFLPGVGQGVATARFVASILQTISSPEFLDVLDAFSKDGFGAFEKIFESLAQVVKLDELANVLIFRQEFEETTRDHPSLRGKQERQKKVESKGGAWSRIGKLLKNVIEIGVRILDQIKRLAHRVQVPIRDAQLWVLRHPAAVLILDLIERGFEFLSSLSIDDLAQAAEDLVEKGWQEMMKEAVQNAAQEVTDRGRDTLDTLRHLELPEEVIPVEWVIDFIIDLAVRALSAKYRKGVQAVRGILRTLGLWDKILKVIKEGLYEGGVDPNELYRRHVRSKLEPWLENARDQFAGDLTAVLQDVPFLKAITQPKGTPIKLDFSGLGFPESQAFDPDPRMAKPAIRLPLPGGGTPLPTAERYRVEAILGHDFGHVRLHHGGDAARVTQSFGAEAITTGSHIYLRPGLTTESNAGKKVLRHELVHVVQQTGPRPLGKKFSDTPSVGRPGQGLNWDPDREAAADRAMDRQSGKLNSPPIKVDGEVDGLQPSFTRKFLRGFLRELHRDADIKDAEKKLEGDKTITLDEESKAVATALGPAIKPWLDKKATYQDPFSSVHAELKTFAEAVWPTFEATIGAVVAHAVMTMQPPKGSGIEEGTVPYLPAESLKVQLQRELYGLTSMAFVIELNTVKGPKTVDETEIVDKKKPVKNVSIVYVHLPLLKQGEDSEKLWDLLVKNTYQGTSDYSSATHDSFKAALKLVISRGSPSPDTYQRSAFKLSTLKARVVRNQRERLVEYIDTAKTASWPDASEYVKTSTSGVASNITDFGLRLGTYSTWGPSAKTVNDRDAHHLTQFLLFEYFRNVKARKPFPLLDTNSYPGVVPTGHEVKSITKGSETIDVEKYYPDRGGAMTTIFIARTTHQSGIHYRTEAPDDGSNKRNTQGFAIDNTFRSFLGDYADVMKDAAQLTQLAQNKKDNKNDEPIGTGTPIITVSRVEGAIFDAAQKTYKDMWGEMKPKLKNALRVNEVAYYNSIAKLRQMPEISKDAMTEPFKTVAQESEKEIGTTAGFGPGFAPAA